MTPGARYLSDAYDAFLASCEVRPNPSNDESCNLFEAFLEVNGIPTQDFSDEDWFEFLGAHGITDREAQYDYLERIADWGGVIVRARQNAQIGRL